MSCKDHGYLFRCQTPNLVTFQCYVSVGFHLVDGLLVSQSEVEISSGLFLRLPSLGGLQA